MMKSKISVILSVGMLAATALAGCSTGSEPHGASVKQNEETTQTLEIWQRKAPGSPSDKIGQEVAKAFSDATGVQVEFSSILEDFEIKLQQRASQGDLPDIVINDTAQLGNMKTQGLLREIEPAAIEGSDKIKARAWEGAKAADGKFYGVPHTAQTVALFNRADWRKNVGAEVPTNWDELVKLWEAYSTGDPTGTGKDVAGLGVPGATKRGYISWNTSSFFWSGGGEYFKDNGSGKFTSEVANAGSISAAQWIRGLVCEHDVLQPGAGSQDTTNVKELFQTGAVGSYLVAPYELASFDINPGRDVVEVIAPPAGPAGLTTLAEGNNVYLMAGSANELAQEKFAEWAVSVEGQTVAMAGDREGNLVRIPVNSEVDMSKLRTDSRWQMFEELYEENGRYVPAVPNWAPFLNSSAETLNTLISDCSLDVAAEMKKLDGKFTAELDAQGALAE